MDFNQSLLEAIAQDAHDLRYFSDFDVEPLMLGYGQRSRPQTHAGILKVSEQILNPKPINESDVLILGPGSTFEPDQFWRHGAARVVCIDNTNARVYDYGVEDAAVDLPFPTEPRGTDFRLLVTKRVALVEKPKYEKIEDGLRSEDGRVIYLKGDIVEVLQPLEQKFDLVTAVNLFEVGYFGYPEAMTELKMFGSCTAEGRKCQPSDISASLKAIAHHLRSPKAALLIKNTNKPTFLSQADIEANGLSAENYNTPSQYGWFTILRKTA